MGLRRKFLRELAAMGLPRGPGVDGPRVTQAELEPLPRAARRYLTAMGVVGRPRVWSFRIRFTGRFRRSATEPWMDCEAWQYNSRIVVTRIFYLRLRMFGVVPVLGRDTYRDGRGRMMIRPFDLFTVGDGIGEAYDVGELVTWLDDAVMMAPSMLLGPGVTFLPVDDDSFDVSLRDRGHIVRARVFLDERGFPRDLETMDRFYADPEDPDRPIRCRWTTPVQDWRQVDGRWLPGTGQAVWHFPQSDLSYAEFAFDPATFAVDVAPS